MRFDRPSRAAGTTAAHVFWLVLLSCLSGCAADDQVKVPLDRAVKQHFQQAESIGQFASVPAQNVVFTNEVGWNTFWKKLSITPPGIDFTSTNVFAVFGGQKPSSGYAVEIRSIVFQPEQKKLRIEVLEVEPPPSAGTLSVLTFPYDIVTFPSPGDWKTFAVTKQKRRGKP